MFLQVVQEVVLQPEFQDAELHRSGVGCARVATEEVSARMARPDAALTPLAPRSNTAGATWKT